MINRKILFFLTCILFLFAKVIHTFAAEQETQAQSSVYILPIKGPIDKSMLMIFRRAFREIKKNQAKAVILKIDTPGGGLNETRELIDWIRATRKSGCEVYAFVEKDALSAGAILSIACKEIFMSEAAIIGSALPISISPFGGGVQELPDDVKEKILSAVRAIVTSLAQENSYREDVVIAMVDPEHDDLFDGDKLLCPKGKLLNLTARDAKRISSETGKPLFASAMLEDIPAVLKKLDYNNYELISFKEEEADKLARIITALGPLLLGLGVLALWIEFKTPGFGIFGISGICLLVIYFFGHYIAGLAGMEEIALIALGFILLAIEIFLIPGFGITGISGILCIFIGAGLAVIPQLPNVLPLEGVEPISKLLYVAEAVKSLLMTIVVVTVGIFALRKILPKTPFYSKMVLTSGLSSADGFTSSSDAKQRESLLGKTGISQTALHPSGFVIIDGKRVDVLTEGEYIPAKQKVEVIHADGFSVKVKAVE